MSIMSRLLAKMYKLPPAETYDIAVDKKLGIPMHDGVNLYADRYYPRGRQNLPTLLVRTPYGRAGYGSAMGVPMAERGFQVLVQSCRGSDDSGGVINAFRGEREDGLATLDWLKQQDWFDGRLGMLGPSYLGFTQWAIAREGGPILKAISTQVTSTEFRSVMYPGGSFNLEIFLQWIQITHSLRASGPAYFAGMLSAGRKLKAGVMHLPLREADKMVVGEPVNSWREWLDHSAPGDPWWGSEDFSGGAADVTAPNHLISGWYDFMLPQLLRDYTALHNAGRRPYLTIGPWSHSSNGLAQVNMLESIKWMRAHLLGEVGELRAAPTRIFVMGAGEWRDLDAWPPVGIQEQRWYLQPEAALALEPAPDSQPSRYRYDPANPTPNAGGATNATLGKGTGAQDNRKLEARADVLVFSSLPLARDLEAIGPVRAELFVQSSLAHTDFFVRLCDVYPDGKSMNVCDGILSLSPGSPPSDANGCRMIVVDLWPTAYRFKAGHRLRVQVSSGAFPRFARNLGTGEPLATGTSMRAADQQIFHDPARPSVIILPVV